ncbi:hypothetical protein PIB30_086192 [Stylosanthes scabra]|uniref:Uncharacterized protein n=1 Tax=Stylosanthes scabra TaxID=79078 RepID=A0ABU6TV11_9FABA|nr:hypothetical protein [Stylosanthes scabra]
MRRGGDKLRIATNGASIGALDQKLSRPEAADEQWRIDTESILNRFSVNFLPISTLGKGANELKAHNFALEIHPTSYSKVIPQRYPLEYRDETITLEISSRSQTQYVRPKLLDLSGVLRVRVTTKRDHLSLDLGSAYFDRPNVNPSQLLPIGIDSGISGLVFVMFESTLQGFRIDSAQDTLCLHMNRFDRGTNRLVLHARGYSRAQRIDPLRQESIQLRFHPLKSPSSYFSSILVSPKVLATMSCHKTPVVKLKNVPSKDPPQLSQLPLRKWFANKELWEDYQSFYSKMPILPPRFLSEGLLSEDKHPKFWELLDHQGLRPLLFTRERYYPRMMAAVATTLWVHDGIYDSEGDGEFRLWFWLAGFKYTLDLGQLSSILGLRNSGVLFKGGSEVPKRLTSFDSEIAAQRLRVSRITGKKHSVSAMRTDHRLLQYMLSYIWLPRKGNHGVLTEEDLIILWAMVRKVNTGLGHGALWTRIFKHLGVDLSGEEAVLVDDKNAITTRHLNKMGRGPKAKAERNEDAGEGSSNPQNVSSSTHFTPEFMESFTQGMQSLHSSWSEGVQGMDQRLDGYESRLSNRTKEIQELGNDMHRFFSHAAQSEDQGP